MGPEDTSLGAAEDGACFHDLIVIRRARSAAGVTWQGGASRECARACARRRRGTRGGGERSGNGSENGLTLHSSPPLVIAW